MGYFSKLAKRTEKDKTMSTATNTDLSNDNENATELSSFSVKNEPDNADSNHDAASLDLKKEKEVGEWKPSKQELLVFITLSIISLMVAFDATIIVTSLNAITQGIGATTVQAFWIGTSYLLACAVVMPFIASVSEIFGRFACILSSLLIFTLGTIVCCAAKDFTTICVGRTIQGVGGGGIQVLTMVIITDIVPLRHRPKILSLFIQLAWAVGSCFGPFFGGLIAQHSTWRWVFYMMFPFAGLGLLLLPLTLRLKLKEQSTFKEKISRVDWIGGIVFIGGLTSFLIAISWGGTQEPWKSWRTIVPLLVGLVAIMVAAVWERWYAKEPFFKKSLWNNPASIVAYVGALVQGLMLYAGLYYTPFYFQSIRQASPTRAGVLMFSVTFSLVPVSVVVGGIITKTGKYRSAIWLGWLMIAFFSGLYVLFDRYISIIGVVFIMIFAGMGHGILLPALNIATQAMADAEDSAAASSMYMFSRSLGMAIGVAIGGTVFQNVMELRLAHNHQPTDIARFAEAYIAAVWKLSDPFKSEILEAYVYGFHGVFGVLCGIAGIVFFASFILKAYSLDRENQTGHVMAGRSERKETVTQEV